MENGLKVCTEHNSLVLDGLIYTISADPPDMPLIDSTNDGFVLNLGNPQFQELLRLINSGWLFMTVENIPIEIVEIIRDDSISTYEKRINLKSLGYEECEVDDLFSIIGHRELVRSSPHVLPSFGTMVGNSAEHIFILTSIIYKETRNQVSGKKESKILNYPYEN